MQELREIYVEGKHNPKNEAPSKLLSPPIRPK
ncbi:MAG: hypothetical protein UW95_C0001G0125 [Parcubacteria group bacterium GW2011_GWC1_45_14]|nr:MAG: hypothetical protein UW95_C0001G0125 [Parcubacteria group bacterium GW2011_GWC1_45_14]